MKFWLKAFLISALLLTGLIAPSLAAGTVGKLSVKFTLTPSKTYYDLGETIRIETQTSKKSDQNTAELFVNGEKITSLQTETTSKYVNSIASYTPDKVGTYKFLYKISTVDASGKAWEGKVEKQIKIEGGRLTLSISPATASMRLGDEIYLLAKYPANQINSENPLTVKTNYEDLTEVVSLGDTITNGYYQKLFKFKPNKVGSFKFTVTVNNVGREGVATANISVKK